MSNPILVTVRYTVKDGKREEFYRHIVEQSIDTASREEAGNRKYDYYYPVTRFHHDRLRCRLTSQTVKNNNNIHTSAFFEVKC